MQKHGSTCVFRGCGEKNREKSIFLGHFFGGKDFCLIFAPRKTSSVRLAGPGRKILILEIMGSNPIPSTTKFSKPPLARVGALFLWLFCEYTRKELNHKNKGCCLPTSVLTEFCCTAPPHRDGQAKRSQSQKTTSLTGPLYIKRHIPQGRCGSLFCCATAPRVPTGTPSVDFAQQEFCTQGWTSEAQSIPKTTSLTGPCCP